MAEGEAFFILTNHDLKCIPCRNFKGQAFINAVRAFGVSNTFGFAPFRRFDVLFVDPKNPTARKFDI